MPRLVLLICLAGFFLVGFGRPALAGDNTSNPSATYTITEQGSTLTHRSMVDLDSAEVYIYAGGTFPAGTNLVAFKFLFDFNEAGNTMGYITPLLFARVPTGSSVIYKVAGMAKGFAVTMSSVPQKIPFAAIEGIKVPPNGSFTFGYVNALVNASGMPVATSPGTVDFDDPADSGAGLGGPQTTNVWEATAISPSPVVALGTTFGPPGSGADHTFFGTTRTYSAQVSGVVVTP